MTSHKIFFIFSNILGAFTHDLEFTLAVTNAIG